MSITAKSAPVTLASCVADAKCRKGPADGTTKRGAYWLACEPIKIRAAGGDGVGQSGADITYTLMLRHFRSGDVIPTIRRHSWHQNSGAHNSYMGCGDALGKCASVEEVVVALKGLTMDNGADFGPGDDEPVYSDGYSEELTAALQELGLPLSAPSPDDDAGA